ncbi:MAG: nucleotidyltransferase family protein, partial [Gammaproteobacteria bacterium]|nr:nucleotidyltransferase family protein [Gammaproteobacteria bacterium]
LEVGRASIIGLGVGGLLKETPDRPLPRALGGIKPAPEAISPRVFALVLAAGQSRRMGKINKLLADIDGLPLVRRVVDTVKASSCDGVIVVTGHEAAQVETALEGASVGTVRCADYASGLSASLKTGVDALPGNCDAAVICLGDMPGVTADHIDRLIAAFDPMEGRAVCVPTFEGKRGNPVLWHRGFFSEIASVRGDVGARHLIGEHEDLVCEVAMEDPGVLLDVDTPKALESVKIQAR